MSGEDSCHCCGASRSNKAPAPARLDVRGMMRSGQAVNSTVTPSIVAGISALETEIKDLGRDISRLGALINQKKTRIAVTKSTLLEYRSAMAPIRTLPPEMLLHIFTLANEDHALFPHSFPNSRMRIGHVCKAWRSLSRASPSLWNDISFAGNYWSPTLSHWVPKYVEQSLVLSCPRPLHISFVFPSSHYLDEEDPHHLVHSYITKIVLLLCGHASRWKTLSVAGPEFACSRLFESLDGFHFESLESLTIRCTETENIIISGPSQRFSLGPRLRTLKLNFESANYMTIHWTTLTSFSGAFLSNSECYIFLAAASKLETLTLIHIDDRDDLDASTPPRILSNLRHLILYSCAVTRVLGRFTMPNLERLEIEHRRYEMPPEHPSQCRTHNNAQTHVAELLSRSQCPLSSIAVSGPISPTEFIPLLSPTLRSSIKTFKVTLDHDTSDCISALLGSLTTTQDGHFFCNLVELEIAEHMTDVAVYSNPRLMPAILSRWHPPPGVAQLQKLTLSGEYMSMIAIERPHHSSSLSICLQELSDKGLDVQWKMDQEDVLALGREYYRSMH